MIRTAYRENGLYFIWDDGYLIGTVVQSKQATALLHRRYEPEELAAITAEIQQQLPFVSAVKQLPPLPERPQRAALNEFD